jgi:hypothetical protein
MTTILHAAPGSQKPRDDCEFLTRTWNQNGQDAPSTLAGFGMRGIPTGRMILHFGGRLAVPTRYKQLVAAIGTTRGA